MTEIKIDENLHTLHGRIPHIGMDTKNNGGIHLWIRGTPFEGPRGEYSISVHLSKDQAVMLAKEILYRIVNHFKKEVEFILKKEF